MITMIPRSRLEPHPDNPRKDLGDLTELAASIKRSGLLQNLTVVPHPDKPDMYRIIIGHRRFAASEMAGGIDELPCAIEDMSPADQLATMLTENMQRNDLTLTDQVDGMQMMMDLGVPVKDIADKTGLSETSVRKRVTISALPREGMRTAVDKGATLLDLLSIMELENEGTREEVLNSFGTNNWQYALSDAKRKERSAKFEVKMKPLLKGVKKVKSDSDIWNGKLTRVCEWRMDDEGEPEPPVLEDGKEYSYYKTGFSIQLYVRNEEYFKRQEAEKATKMRREAIVEKGKELDRRAYELRCEFVRKFRCNDAMRKKLWEKMFDLTMKDHSEYTYYHRWEMATMRDMLAIPLEEDRDKDETFEAELKRRGVPHDRWMLVWMLCGGVMEPSSEGYCSGYDGSYRKNERLDSQYELLELVGYVPSDFEKSLRDGSHPFFEDPEVEI